MSLPKEQVFDTKSYISTAPINLTDTDLELIYRQCELQQATNPDELEGFRQAYLHAKTFSHQTNWDQLDADQILLLVLELALLTEKTKNPQGFRIVPVVFASGDRGIDPVNISRTMRNWAESYLENSATPEDLYEEFEKIHPFQDGNGRVGDLLWKIATQRTTGVWPEMLPPDLFGSPKSPKTYQSSFGEVEN